MLRRVHGCRQLNAQGGAGGVIGPLSQDPLDAYLCGCQEGKGFEFGHWHGASARASRQDGEFFDPSSEARCSQQGNLDQALCWGRQGAKAIFPLGRYVEHLVGRRRRG